jgi:hypothetical protein
VEQQIRRTKNRRYAEAYIEKEIDEEKAFIEKRCEQYGIEIPTMLEKLKVTIIDRPNMCIWQAIDWVILKKKRIKR